MLQKSAWSLLWADILDGSGPLTPPTVVDIKLDEMSFHMMSHYW